MGAVSGPSGASQGGPAASVMEGHGVYNRFSRPQHEATAYAVPMLQQAVAAMDAPQRGELFTVADFGVAGGRNSMEPMRAVIEAVRAKGGPDTPLAIVHSDLPTNDFSGLFTLLADSPESYQRDLTGVYAFAAGRTLYQRVVPDGWLWLGYSAITAHWLSAAPCPIPDHIWSPFAPPPVKAAFAERARQDWQTFLVCRAEELRPGGRLILLVGGGDPDGLGGGENLLDLTNEVLRELVADGTLRPAEYARMTIPTYYRTLEEMTAPFTAGGGSASDTPLGSLALLEATPVVFSDPYWAAYQADGDVEAFAAAESGFLRAFTEPVLLSALDPDRDAAARQEIGNEIFDRLRARIVTAPDRAVCAWRVALLAIAKRAQ